jgi:hypothetical protein
MGRSERKPEGSTRLFASRVGEETYAMCLSLFAKVGRWADTAKLLRWTHGDNQGGRIPSEVQMEADALRKKFLALKTEWQGGRFPS